MNINNNIHNIFSSNIAPNPIDVKYWADLNSDPSGMVIKVYKGGKWVAINKDSEISDDIEELKETVNNKVDKVSGKQLSTNDYTTAEKQKLAGIADNANNYVHPTTDGNKHIPAGGSANQILKWSAAGTAVWADEPAGSTVTVENVLTSDSTTNALSAAQGKALKALIDSLTARVAALEAPAA